MSYRVALIGAGTMGGVHATQWSTIREADVVGVLDPRGEASRALGPHYSDWESLLSQAKPDIVDICVPTPFHREYVERAAAAGMAIFVEKPLARTMADCDAIVELVTRTGVPFMAGHVLRYFPEYLSTKRLVDDGAVGTPAAVRTSRMAGFPHQGIDDWYADPVKSGGVVLDMIIHDFDWLLWTFGPVSRVFACGLYGNAKYVGELDYALVTLRFASGALGHVTGSWAHPGGFRTTLEVAGDGGLIEHDSARTAPLTASLRSNEGGAGGVAVPESPMAMGEDPYFLEIQAFVKALDAGEQPPVTVHDARNAARVALAALESIETGKVVSLS
jgi:UDP-N-acetylglucosamine 3-dehydrogenase